MPDTRPTVHHPRRRALLWASVALVGLVGATALVVTHPWAHPPETLVVQRQDLQEVVEVSGVVESRRAVMLKAEAAGLVQGLAVPENGEAKSGTALLRIDPTQARLQLEQARTNARAAEAQALTALQNARRTLGETADLQKVAVTNARNALAKAQANVAFLGRDLARNEALYVDGAVTRQAIDTQRQQLSQARLDVKMAGDTLDRALAGADLTAARNAVAQAETALATARAQGRSAVALAQEALDKTTVKAPFGGTLTDWLVDTGDMVAPGTPLGSFQDLRDLRLRLPVDELDLPKMHRGGTVRMTFDAYPERTFAGAIGEISRSSVTGAGNVQVFPVQVRFDNREGLIRPGMSADAQVLVRSLKQVVAVPIACVKRAGDKTQVTVLKAGKPVAVDVVPGVATLEAIEIKQGLAAGDRVVTGPGAKP